MRGLRLLRAAPALLGCLGVLLVLGGTPAHAHTALKDATPGPGSRVAPGAEVVSLTFGRLRSGTTPEITLTGPGGDALPVGRPVLAGDAVACAAVGSLRPGVHTLSYAVTSADGDRQSSAFQFEVADGAEPAVTSSVCNALSLAKPDTETTEGGTVLGLGRTTALAVLAGAAAVLVAGGVLTARVLRRARTTRTRGKGAAAA
ncbi:copper resistance protein CopC [Streptomyces violaceus]|uniref:Copper resistance protein CopC n=1 Tax=Streptomyces violaceus TaxID=1936 RepID=A0ABZ1NVE7_STRVL|nr:copper resistance protein CopC [Streptomyces violaceus]